MILFNTTVLKVNPSIYLLLYSAAIFIYIKKFECVRFRNWLKKTNLITNYKYNKILTGCKYNEYFFLTGRFKEVERIFKIIYTEVMHFRYLTYVLFNSIYSRTGMKNKGGRLKFETHFVWFTHLLICVNISASNLLLINHKK